MANLVTTLQPSFDGSYNPLYPNGNKPETERAVYDAVLSARTRTLDLEKVATGAGTVSDPWNPTQAQTLVAPGDIVAILPGIFTGVDPVSSRNITPGFYPKVSGTDGNPIIYIAENPAVYETTGLSEFRSGGTVLGSGWPALGTKSTTDIKYMGVYSDNNVANNKAATDSATASFRLDSHRCAVSFSELIGNSGQTDNYSAVRVETSDNCRVYNSKLHGYTGFTNNSGVILYKSNGFETDNNEIYNCTHGIQTKDSTTGDPTQDLFDVSAHHNLIYNVTHGFRFHAPIKGPSGELSNIYQNIVHDATYFMGLTSAAQTTGEQNGLMIYNNVGYNITTGIVSLGFDYQLEGVVPRDNRIFNNIFKSTGSYLYTELVAVSNVPYFDEYAEYSTNCISDYTIFANGDNSGTLDGLTPAVWSSTYNQDVASVYADPLFTDPLTDDFTLQPGSPCLTTGVDLLGKFGTVDSAVPMGVYVTGSDEIGVRA